MLEEREELKIKYREVEETERKAGQKMPPLYVLTNRSGWYGASCILYPGLLQKLAAQLGDDLFILPSSVHEVILLPVRAAGGPAELEAMVKEVNATEVDPEEVLSDSVYRYSLSRKAIQKIFVKSKTS